ncbi:MAG: protein translocase subunit SecD, partial [Flavobacteriaceae bacterium]|nr:protein translocase subunit SecD [Flavobacteriaceae bacterium]
MQNKGIIKLFALLFGVVSVYQVSFTFKANQIEKQAQSAAIQKIADSEPDYDSLRKLEVQRYLDSISNQQVYNIGITSYTYNEVKDRAMNLGLDLKGGVNVVLQISVKDILKGLANNSSNPIFNQALSDAEEIQKNSQNTYLEDFFVAFDAIKGDTKLSDPDIFANRTMSEEITFDMTDEQVRPVLERKIDESIVSAFEVIRKRIDKFGVTQPNIQRLGKSGRILVELPGAKDVERVKKLLQSTAQLEFWETFQGQSFMPFLAQANEVLKSELAESSDDTASTEDAQENVESQLEAALGEVTTDSTAVAEVNPLFDLIKGQGYQGGPVIAIFDIKDKQTVTDYLSRPEIKSLLSPEQRFVKFMWGIESPESELIELYAIQGNREGVPELSGAVITDARQSYSNTGKPSVSMQMNAKGAKIWEEMTGKAFNSRGQIAIVLDDIVYSAPGVTTGPISGGNSEISGQFTINEAVDLANVLRAGKLPASADIVQAEEVGPSLGIEAINSGKISFLIALALVVFWMIFYYGRAGIYSNVALLLNILLMFGFLAGLGAVLTLPGIAGIVLTVGIAVDANVLIYERIKEELAKGKGQKQSVSDGFGNALSSIMDANITTALTALILYVFGTGSIKGFATTLLIGIVTSLFTAIFITRFFIDRDNNKGVALKFSTLLTKGLFQNIDIKFLKKRFIMYGVSLILIIVGLSSLFTRGLDQGIDFVGGRTYQVRFAQDVNAQEVSTALVDVFGSAEVKTIGSPNQL